MAEPAAPSAADHHPLQEHNSTPANAPSDVPQFGTLKDHLEETHRRLNHASEQVGVIGEQYRQHREWAEQEIRHMRDTLSAFDTRLADQNAMIAQLRSETLR